MSEVKINSMYRNFNVVVARGFIPRNWPTTRDRRYVSKDAFKERVVGFCLLKPNLIYGGILFKQVLGMGSYPTKQTG